MRTKRGFTIVELIIVVAIIGLLAAIILMALDDSRKKGRDANRASQAQEFMKAAELYYSDNGGYPDDEVNDSSFNQAAEVDGFYRANGGYLSSVPPDPFYDAANGYQYCSSADGDSYTIIAHPESDTGDFCRISRGPDTVASYCGATAAAYSDCTGRF